MSETDSKPAGHQGDSEGAADKKEHRPKLQHDDIPLPPKDFIPLKASEEERLSYGFPARPNPETHRKQYEIWERTLGVPLKIQPHVPRKKVDLQIPRKASESAPKIRRLQPLPSGPGTPFWGTAASVYQSLSGCTNVTATWTIPQLQPPVNPVGGGPWAVSCVVQLDGVLLGGTTSYVSNVNGQIQTGAYAFATFLSNEIEFSNYQILNVDVTPGQSVTCSVCAPFSTTYGTCLFSNQTTGQATSLLVNQPSRIDVLTRTSAAWGVVVGSEDEEYIFSQQPPYFDVIALIDCSASSPASSLGLEPGEVISNLNNPTGSTPNPIWQTYVLTSSVVWVLNEAT